MPSGCGTWPAFWLLGPDWPNSGEVDIIEGVNSQSSNSFAMHTNAGCSITDSGTFSGSIETSNCDINAPGQGVNVGCAIKTSDTRSFGPGFNAAGGGVYATEWTSDAISIWFFPRGNIPSDVDGPNPDPSTWGRPAAQFGGACELDTHVKDQQLVFTNTFCGDWAGQVWANDATCAPRGSSCDAYVRDNPAAFAEAYWDIKGLRVYQGSSSASQTNSTAPYPLANATSGAISATGSAAGLPMPNYSFMTITTASATDGVVAPLPTASQEQYTSTTLPCPDPTAAPGGWARPGQPWAAPGYGGTGGGRSGFGRGGAGGRQGGWRNRLRRWI
jgi:hypothetical protein